MILDAVPFTEAIETIYQNFPVLASALTNGITTTITGTFSEATEPKTTIPASHVPDDTRLGPCQ
jgi:hypothetical protein